jgi:hypothetical protein
MRILIYQASLVKGKKKKEHRHKIDIYIFDVRQRVYPLDRPWDVPFDNPLEYLTAEAL